MSESPQLYKIEKGIQLPPRSWARSGESKYPVKNMEPGDSFFVPLADLKKVDSARNTIKAAGRAAGKTIECRRWTAKDDAGRDVTGIRAFCVTPRHAGDPPKAKGGK